MEGTFTNEQRWLLDKELRQVEWLETQVQVLEQEIERRVAEFEEPIGRLLIEGLRDNTTQKFGQTEYRIATKLEIVKWVGAAAFYGLWAGGAVDAAIHFKPETQLQDKLLVPPAPGAPTGSLHPEERRAPRHAKAEPVTASYEGAP